MAGVREACESRDETVSTASAPASPVCGGGTGGNIRCNNKWDRHEDTKHPGNIFSS